MLRFTNSFAGALVLAGLMGASQVGAAETIPSAIAAAVADAGRPDADRQRDANRKPAEVVAFAGIHKGEHIAELLPGGGYFTRIFSKVVGDDGVVYALTPPPRPNSKRDPAAAVKAIAETYRNVRVLPLGGDPLVPEKVDLVWTSLNYHDLHNRPNADLASFNKSVFDALKPGGTYIVIDHAAERGSGARDTSKLHRIDPELVKSEVTAAGFVLDGESTVLHNPQDAHTTSVHDPSIRGTTDQFVLKFRKPAE